MCLIGAAFQTDTELRLRSRIEQITNIIQTGQTQVDKQW